MANQKDMTVRHSIIALYKKGWSKSRIARELEICRETVIRYVYLGDTGEEVPAGGNSKPTVSPTGNEASKPTVLPAGENGRQSLCKPYSEHIKQAMTKGLDAQRIWQDLRDDHGVEGAYDSVKRFVRKEKAKTPGRIHRIEVLPGEEAQVDFGKGGWIKQENGRKKQSWILRVVLSCSRKGYSEAVFTQDTESFIRCLENAFRHFGGVPQTINLDNLRAAVTKADWYEPDIHPKLESFSRHYGTVILPCRVRKPEHKGKVESGVKYVKNNAIKGRIFSSLMEENQFLLHWEETIADSRIHGTTRQQVRKHFLD